METILQIDGKPVKFKATAAVPRLYRIKFGQDIIQDLDKLRKAYVKVSQNQEEEFKAVDLEIFENCAYIMAKHAAPEDVPSSIEEWMEQFHIFSIYEILPEVLRLWGLNEQVTVESKKKLDQVAGS